MPEEVCVFIPLYSNVYMWLHVYECVIRCVCVCVLDIWSSITTEKQGLFVVIYEVLIVENSLLTSFKSAAISFLDKFHSLNHHIKYELVLKCSVSVQSHFTAKGDVRKCHLLYIYV